jgi:hypothetical protein
VAFVPSIDDPVYPVFDRSLSRVIRMVRAGSAAGTATVGAADFVLIWGDAQRAIGAGELGRAAWPWFETADLRPLLEQLRMPDSGWHPILDGALYRPGSFHLFARRPLSSAEAARLPDLLPSSPPRATDRWRGPRFALPVRLDPSRPILRVRGDAGPGTTVAIDVRGPAGERLARLTPPPGEFVASIPLDALFASRRAEYTVLVFETSVLGDGSEPGRAEGGPSGWRSADLALTAR